MIYLVTKQQELFKNEFYTILDVNRSIEILKSWNIIQCDSETSGKNPHLCDFLCFQFGNEEGTIQIVVDCTTIKIEKYKEILESKFTIWANGKFDLQFCYKHNIIPRRIYDVMIAEQVLYLGFPHIAISPNEYNKYSYDFPYYEIIEKKTKELKYSLSFSLQALVAKYCNEHLDKTVRGEIIWRGLDTRVILYAAKDVQKLNHIMRAQLKRAKQDDNLNAVKLECSVVPCMAYMEWCGIKLNEEKWKAKMQQDVINRDKALKKLNDYCIKHPKLQKWVCKNIQLDLFEEVNKESYFNIDWQKNEAKAVFKTLGFDLTTISKTTKQETESVMEKVLNTQKGIDDVFLKLYFDYQGYYKVCTSFGQGHLDLINPKTGRLHTNYWQIGTISSRMSSGGDEDIDIAKYKHLNKVSMVNMQQLPHDEITRSCFESEPGNLFCSCDWAAAEARMGAEVYNEKVLLDEFLIGSGDTHAAYAKAVWPDELEGIETKDIKKKRPDLRNKVKAVEFAVQFGSDGTAAAPTLGITVEEARTLVSNLLKNMKGLNAFKIKGSQEVRKNGYVLAHPKTGHKVYWWDYNKWKYIQSTFTSEFWEEYKLYHKGTKDNIALMVKEHFQAASKWDRMALNIPTQTGCAICMKDFLIEWFNWVVDNNYFNIILLCNVTHDEHNSEFPEELKDTYPNMVATMMQNSAAKYYHKLPIPAEPNIGKCWIH